MFSYLSGHKVSTGSPEISGRIYRDRESRIYTFQRSNVFGFKLMHGFKVVNNIFMTF